MWPSERTAILVIHGIGQQSPYDTLDAFVQGLWETLERENLGSVVEGHHRVSDFDGWTENYISLVKDGNEDNAVDCYEYYWAHETERRTDVGEVFDWLVKVGIAAQKYYDEDENRDSAERYAREGHALFARQRGGKARFKKYSYLQRAGTTLRVAQILMSLINPLVSMYPVIGKPIQFALKLLGRLARPLIVDYIGDIAIYTTTDLKSKHFEVRQKILTGAVNKLQWLLQSTGSKPQYGRIVVAGHSLGSVIAYDALNRVNNAFKVRRILPDLRRKVVGFASFGSPLDKVAFLFSERAPKDKYVKKQILAYYHGFKAKSLTPGWTPPKPVVTRDQPMLNHVRWLNFWIRKDPISGPLDFYDIPQNDNRELPFKGGLTSAHSAYWRHRDMYTQILRELLCQS